MKCISFWSVACEEVSMISNRYAQANNKYLQDYDPEKPSICIIYKDANNLYGHAMSQPLPVGDFKWKTDFEDFEVMTIADDADIGYILEVDLGYPEELHDLYSDYPLAPEKKKSPMRCWLAINKN